MDLVFIWSTWRKRSRAGIPTCGLVTQKEKLKGKFQRKLPFSLARVLYQFVMRDMVRETAKLSNQRPKNYKSPLDPDVAVEMVGVFKVTLKNLNILSPLEFCSNVLLTFSKIISLKHLSLLLICFHCLFSHVSSSTLSDVYFKLLFVIVNHIWILQKIFHF